MLTRLKNFSNKIFNVQVRNGQPIVVRLTNKSGQPDIAEKTLQKILDELKLQRKELSAIRSGVNTDLMHDVTNFHSRQVRSMHESLELLASSEASLARFGDGEFRLMLRPEFNLRFQQNSRQLQEDLKEVFMSKSDDLLVGFPLQFRDAHWSHLYAELWHMLKELIHPEQKFINAHITRPKAFELMGNQAVDLWRQVWDGQDACVVTGEGSRFDLVDELFDNLKSVDFVYSTPNNAYTDVDRLVEEVQQHEAKLVLISLGPAGTVLAYKLAKLGIRALDIGHLSSSYLNVMKGDARPEATPVIRKK